MMDPGATLTRLLVPSPQQLSVANNEAFAWVPTTGTCHLRVLTPSTNTALEDIDLDLQRRQGYARVTAMTNSLKTRYQHVKLVMDMDDGDNEDGNEFDHPSAGPSNHRRRHHDEEDTDDTDDDIDKEPSEEFTFRIVGRVDGVGAHGAPESYVLNVPKGRLPWSIVAKDMSGLFYGIQTILQVLRVCEAYSSLWYDGTITSEYVQGGALSNGVRVPALTVTDWPVLKHRAYMKDIARCRIPTMKELYRMVDLLASFKYNQLQLYMEASYAYEQHEQVWQGTSPMTAEEIQLLDVYCHARCIELVPNQNSLGHMHRWLIHSNYADLSEQPKGMYHPFSKHPTVKEPFGLCATNPKALELVTSLHDELVEQFQSNTLNVGMDETVDLGKDNSKQECQRLGKGTVFVNYLLHIHETCSPGLHWHIYHPHQSSH